MPAHYVAEALKQYARTGDLKIGAIRVSLGPDAKTERLTILKVDPNGPAAAAKVQEKDEIVSVDDVSIDGEPAAVAMKAFQTKIKYMSPGEKVVLTVRRDGALVSMPITLAEPMKPGDVRPQWAPLPKPAPDAPAPKPKKTDYDL